MKLLAAFQKEARKLTKAKDSLERQLNAISAAVKAFGSSLAADSGNGRKKRKLHMSASARARIAKGSTPKMGENSCGEENRVGVAMRWTTDPGAIPGEPYDYLDIPIGEDGEIGEAKEPL